MMRRFQRRPESHALDKVVELSGALVDVSRAEIASREFQPRHAAVTSLLDSMHQIRNELERAIEQMREAEAEEAKPEKVEDDGPSRQDFEFAADLWRGRHRHLYDRVSSFRCRATLTTPGEAELAGILKEHRPPEPPS